MSAITSALGDRCGSTSSSNRQVQVVGAVEEQQSDFDGEIGERLKGIADADLDQLIEAGTLKIRRGLLSLLRQQLGRDDRARAEIAERACEIYRRAPQRGPELDDHRRASDKRACIEQPTDFGCDSERCIHAEVGALTTVQAGAELRLASVHPQLRRPVLALAGLSQLGENLLHPIGAQRRPHPYILADNALRPRYKPAIAVALTVRDPKRGRTFIRQRDVRTLDR